MRAGERLHRVRVGLLVEALEMRRIRMARRQCRDRARARAALRAARPGAGDRRRNARPVARLHVAVHVGAERPREPPPAQRTARIDPRRFREGARRLGRIEAPGQHDALVEIALRQRVLRGDESAVGPHAIEQRGGSSGCAGTGDRKAPRDAKTGTCAVAHDTTQRAGGPEHGAMIDGSAGQSGNASAT